MTINLNIEPYYDDFNEKKNFVKVLFKPGVAVQARELTQLQTAIQEQIKAIGGFLFKNESLVLGGESYVSRIAYIDVIATSTTATVGSEIVGLTTGATAKVVQTKNGVSAGVSRIYIAYTSGTFFNASEIISEDTASPLYSYTIVSSNHTGPAVAYSILQSVFYVNDYFVVAPEQTVVLSDSIDPTARVGLMVTQEIVTHEDDPTLLDPASGTYNYSAPGADRLAITLTLISLPYDPVEGSSAEAVEDTTDDFIELSRFDKGVQIKSVTSPSLGGIEDILARRTFDESGDYTVRSFGLKVKENVHKNTDMLSLAIEPGKAYIKGYEFETTSTLHLDLPRALDTNTIQNFFGEAAYGDYFLINEPTGGSIDFTTNIQATFTGATGTCRIKFIERVQNSPVKLKLHVYDISVTSGAIKDITAVNVTGGWTATVDSTNPNKLYKSKKPAYLVEMVDSPLKNLTDVSYESQVSFSGVVASGSDIILGTLPAGSIFNSSNELDYVVTKANTPFDLATGFTVSGTGTGTVTLSGGEITNGTTYNVIAKIAVTSSTPKTKVRTKTTIYLTNSNATELTLGVSDCYKLISVIAKNSANTNTLDVTARYSMANGQKDNLYDYGSIKLKSGATPASLATYNRLKVIVEHFTTSQSAGYFTVESYNTTSTDPAVVVPYNTIPAYKKNDGKTVSLRDVFDFRPRRTTHASWPGTIGTAYGGTINATIADDQAALPGTSVVTDYSYYLPRIDKLILTKERRFDLIKGIPSELPQIPSDIPDAMTLYIIKVPAFTFGPSDVTFAYVENKRYTMRDIGKIEKRVSRLEYYTSLSLLEKQAADEVITNASGSADKFKNGILVDSFAGHSVGDVGSGQYSCSIDVLTRTLRPRFASESLNLTVSQDTTSGTYSKSDDLVTLPYTITPHITNYNASNWVNLNPFLVFDWNGEIKLDPPTDTWSDKETRPDVVINLNGENDAFTVLADDVENPASVGVKWADWQLTDRGVSVQSDEKVSSSVAYQVSPGKAIETTETTTVVSTTTTVNETQSRSGVEIEKSKISTTTRDLGSKVVDTSIVPFIRSRIVNFSASRLKPATVLFASFDGIDVTRFCTQAPVVFVSNVPSDAKKIRKIGTSKAGDVLLVRNDRVFVKMDANQSIFQIGDSIEWYLDSTGTWVTPSAAVSVTSVSTPTTSVVETDENGDVAGFFTIPNSNTLRFRTGERTFRLADTLGKQPTTAAETKYVAQGLSMSLQKDIISTRVQTVAIKPLFQSVTGTQVDVDISSSIAITQKDVTVLCGEVQSSRGSTGRFEFDLDFGTDVGSCGINFDPTGVPDRYTIIWNGREYTSGFRGRADYNAQLNSRGFPSVSTHVDVNNPATGKLRFTKNLAFPNKARLIVDAPLSGTRWEWKAICPGKTDNLIPETDPRLSIVVDSPSTYTFPSRFAGTRTSANFNFTITVGGNSSLPQGTPVQITSISMVETTNGGYASFGNVRYFLNGSALSLPISTTIGSTVTISASIDLTATANEFGISAFGTRPNPRTTFTVNGQLTTQVEGNLWPTSGSDVTVHTEPNLLQNWFGGEGNGGGTDPVAQTFSISSATNPDGIFIHSLDLFFRKKSSTKNIPIQVQIRTTVNGYPSSSTVLPFATADLLSSDVIVSSDTATNKKATRFKFKAPVYLAPNTEYAIVVLVNSDQFEVFTSRLGEFLLSAPSVRITAQPLLGSLFISQNASAWTPSQYDDLVFALNRCVFKRNIERSIILDADIPAKLKGTGDYDYDVLFVDGEVLDFANTNVDYSFKASTKSGQTFTKDALWTTYQLGSNKQLTARRTVNFGDPRSLSVRCILSSKNPDISPVIDINRLSTVLIKNIINNNSRSEDTPKILTISSISATSSVITFETTATHDLVVGDFVSTFADTNAEVNGNYVVNTTPTTTKFTVLWSGTSFGITVQGGTITRNAQALSRYITRKVTLNQDFLSSDIKVFFDASIPTGCSVIPYYKVTALNDTNIDDNDWVLMTVESTGAKQPTGFAEYKYKAPYTVSSEVSALPNGDRFGAFTVKLVMLTDNSVNVPLIKDLRVLALD